MRLRALPNVVSPVGVPGNVGIPSDVETSNASPVRAELLGEFGTGPNQIADRVVRALEAGEDSLEGLPAKVAGLVLIALGLSAGDLEDLARSLARRFRSDLVAATEATVHMALVEIGRLRSQ